MDFCSAGRVGWRCRVSECAEFWRFPLGDGFVCELRFHGRKPTRRDLEHLLRYIAVWTTP